MATGLESVVSVVCMAMMLGCHQRLRGYATTDLDAVAAFPTHVLSRPRSFTEVVFSVSARGP
jgi:hypothetical protein